MKAIRSELPDSDLLQMAKGILRLQIQVPKYLGRNGNQLNSAGRADAEFPSTPSCTFGLLFLGVRSCAALYYGVIG
jgi:hypothetical protein